MKVYYDLHIHSALSPCASDDMTPLNIVAMASVKGLDVIAINDHNSIENVAAAMECGRDFDVMGIPSMEVQTAEDIHVLPMFEDFSTLKAFHDTFTKRKIFRYFFVCSGQLGAKNGLFWWRAPPVGAFPKPPFWVQTVANRRIRSRRSCTGACQSAALVTGGCFFRRMVGGARCSATVGAVAGPTMYKLS